MKMNSLIWNRIYRFIYLIKIMYDHGIIYHDFNLNGISIYGY